MIKWHPCSLKPGVNPAHSNQGSSATQTQSNQVQASVIKTMILISAFYVISCTPVYVYFMLANVKPDLNLLSAGYYIIVFISFFYICANPFVYAVKFDPIRRILLGLIPCKKRSQEPGSGSDAGSDSVQEEVTRTRVWV